MSYEELANWLRSYLADLLGATPDEVCVVTPLEYLGVDSATALVLGADISAQFGCQLNVGEIFDHPNVRSLAEYLCQ